VGLVERRGGMTSHKEYAVAVLRVVSLRLKHIDSEITAISIALAGDMIDVKEAFRVVDEIAPGCIDAVARSILDGAAQ
jgi:hypothetical protein